MKFQLVLCKGCFNRGLIAYSISPLQELYEVRRLAAEFSPGHALVREGPREFSISTVRCGPTLIEN
jgi:hypothetical protein